MWDCRDDGCRQSVAAEFGGRWMTRSRICAEPSGTPVERISWQFTGRHGEADVDAVDERAGELRNVALDHGRRAVAFAGCGRWGSRRGRGPWRWPTRTTLETSATWRRGRSKRAVFERDLSRARNHAAADQSSVADGGGRPERTPTNPGRRTPATVWILAVSNASSKVNGGRRGGARGQSCLCRSRAGRSSGCCDHRRTGFSARAWRSAGLGQPGGAYQHLLQSRTLRIRTLMTIQSVTVVTCRGQSHHGLAGGRNLLWSGKDQTFFLPYVPRRPTHKLCSLGPACSRMNPRPTLKGRGGRRGSILWLRKTTLPRDRSVPRATWSRKKLGCGGSPSGSWSCSPPDWRPSCGSACNPSPTISARSRPGYSSWRFCSRRTRTAGGEKSRISRFS